ncbi:MAG TPA: MarR family winged helix-turn-helix transcriptional regulator [Polyangia bacterium]|jgi:MarR family 2-MHQ and catechol resistance regulon transcriptional repressor
MPTRHAGPAHEVRALNCFIKLMRAADTVSARLGRTLTVHGLTMGQLGVLEALLHAGPMCQRDLGRKLLRSGANVTTVVDNLERVGLVKRERGAPDRRLMTVSLTGAGRTLIGRVFPDHVASIAAVFGALAPAEQEELARLCKKLGLAAAAPSADSEPLERTG